MPLCATEIRRIPSKTLASDPRTPLQKRYATFLTALILPWSMAVPRNANSAIAGSVLSSGPVATIAVGQQSQLPSETPGAAYEGKPVVSVDLQGASGGNHWLELLPQKVWTPLRRDDVRDSIRILYATGRFADIQAEVVPSGDGVILTFRTSPNFFVGAVDVEGAPSRPNSNQIVNASKFQLGELYNREKLERALENIRQVMQENGFYRARVTAESTSDATTQQVNILFHVSPGSQARVGKITVTGTSRLSSDQLQRIARMDTGDRLTAARISNSLQRLRRRFQKERRALAQVSIAEQTFRPDKNAVDFTFQVDPGPIVLITAEGFHISRGTMKKQVPVFEENAVDDDLLNEGRRNLLDYLQTKGHFDAKVDIRKKGTSETLHVIYVIDPGPIHKLAAVEIIGNKNFLDTQTLRSYLQIQPASRLLSHGRYSEALLRNDVATLQG